ncbi:hypothetical protein PAMP_012125 [Pampus punctatissimus]
MRKKQDQPSGSSGLDPRSRLIPRLLSCSCHPYLQPQWTISSAVGPLSAHNNTEIKEVEKIESRGVKEARKDDREGSRVGGRGEEKRGGSLQRGDSGLDSPSLMKSRSRDSHMMKCLKSWTEDNLSMWGSSTRVWVNHMRRIKVCKHKSSHHY